MPATAAERIRALITAATSGRPVDVNDIYVRALMRCGISREEAAELVANDHDPVLRILHFAGDSHNFAVLAVEEALAAA